METYRGYVRTPLDAIILFEACRIGLLPRVQRRLSEKERQAIRSGSVFVWDEREAGMRRWTDGKSWSASRVSGSFLTYREMEGRQRSDDDDDDEHPSEGYRYKPDGLMKQSFSVSTSTNLKLHLISYFSRNHNDLMVPSHDVNLKSIVIPKGLYPDASAPLDQHPNQQFHYVQQSPPYMPPPTAPIQYSAAAASPPQIHHHNAHHQHAHHHSPQPPPVPTAGGGPPPHFQPYTAQPQFHSAYHQENRPVHHQQNTNNDPTRPKQLLPFPKNNTLPPPHHGNLNAKEIPYEKVVWGEDARAIQVLDRRFYL